MGTPKRVPLILGNPTLNPKSLNPKPPSHRILTSGPRTGRVDRLLVLAFLHLFCLGVCIYMVWVPGLGFYAGIVGYILRLCRDNGKENGNYYNGVIYGVNMLVA